MNDKGTLSISEAAKWLGVSVNTLRNWDKQNILIPIRTPGGQRRYTLSCLRKFNDRSIINPPSLTLDIPGRKSVGLYFISGVILTFLLVFAWKFLQVERNLLSPIKQESTNTVYDKLIYSNSLNGIAVSTETQKNGNSFSDVKNSLRKFNVDNPPVNEFANFTQLLFPARKILDWSNSNLDLKIIPGASKEKYDQTRMLQASLRYGQATIASGEASVEVRLDVSKAQGELNQSYPIITITPLSKTNLDWYRVTEVKYDQFTIEVNRPTAEDIKFNWIAIL